MTAESGQWYFQKHIFQTFRNSYQCRSNSNNQIKLLSMFKFKYAVSKDVQIGKFSD